MYQVNKEDGYIVSVVVGASQGNITEEEYNAIIQAVHSKPKAPDGFDYKLKENLEWVLCEMPIVEEDEPATEEDYQDALESLGVNFNA